MSGKRMPTGMGWDCGFRRVRMQIACTLLAAVACLVLCADPAACQGYTYNADNDAAMALFRMGGSARGQAMGGAYVSLSRGAESVYWNPGGLAYQKTTAEVSISPRIVRGEDYELVEDGRAYFAAQASARWRTWALGVGVSQLGSGDLLFNDGESYEVNPSRTFSNAQTGLVLAIGGTFMQDHLGVGLAVRRLNSSFSGELGQAHLSDTRGTGTAIQVGGIYRVDEHLAAGLTYDLPSSMDWGLSDKDDSAGRLQTGASYRLLRDRTIGAIVAAQAENTGGAWARLHIGCEVTVMKQVSFRMGYRNLHLRSSEFETDALNETGTLTFGIGTSDIALLRSTKFSLDIAYDNQDFNSQIAATLRIGF